MKLSMMRQWHFWLTLGAALGLKAMADATAPQIVDIKPDGANVAVRVKVGAGTQRITIEGRPQLKNGSWTPRGNAWLNGQAGEITVRFPASGQMDMLRASADDSDSLPLPASFYAGKTNFPPLITATSPNTSTGPVSGGAAGGADGSTSFDTTGRGSGGAVTVESDIWKVDSNTVYFFNQYRGLQVIDISQPTQPVLKATLPISGAGEQMYVLSSTGPGNAWIALVTRSSCGYSDSQIVLVQVQDGLPTIKSRLDLGGNIVESRLVGTRLVAAATELYNYNLSYTGNYYYSGYMPTLVSSFNLADPANPVVLKTTELPIYGTVVSASDGYFLVSGIGLGSDKNTGYEAYTTSAVAVLDVSDATVPPQYIGTANLAGTIADKFKLNAQDGVLSAVSQIQGGWRGGVFPQWQWQPPVITVETFTLGSSTNLARLGRLNLVTNETLFGTRFDGDRLYAVTFHQVDPLWIIDLSAPAKPAITGKLQVPGFSTFLQPMGNRLLTLGVVTNHVAASLFDVSSPAAPALLSHTLLGDGYSGTEANWDEKAFSVFPDQGLIVLPWWGQRGSNQWFQGLQLIDLGDTTVAARGIIARDSSPRRIALANPTNLVSVSGQELFTAGFADPDQPNVLATLPLLFHVDTVLTWGNSLIELANTGTESYAQLALKKAPESTISRLTLTNYPITGASINGRTLAIFQHQNDNYHWDPILTTNPVVTRVPQPPGIGFTTNILVTWTPQPPVTECTNILRTIVIPPSPLGPGYTTNYWVKVCRDIDQPPILTTNTVVETVKIPLPDLIVTNLQVNTTYTNWVEYGASRVTRVDLSDTGLVEAGHWDGYLTNLNGGSAKALWVSANTVVWIQQNNYWGYPILYLADAGVTGRFAPGGAFMPGYYSPSSGRTLAAFGLDQSVPQFLGQNDLPAPDGATITASFVSGSKIYVGHQFSVPGGQLGTNSFDGKVYYFGFWAPYGDWETHYFLDVVDYGDPANPVLRAPLELPGSLTGISHKGNLLYTLQNGWGYFGSTTNALTALAYDGLSASTVDALPLKSTPPLTVDPSGAVYLAQASVGTNSPATLEAWALNVKAKWQRYASVPTGIDISTLTAFDNLLVGSNGTDLTGFDLTNPLSPTVLGVENQGCLWFNLAQADGDLAGGLWVPRGDYGLFHADFGTTPGN